MGKNLKTNHPAEDISVSAFKERFPWIGGDLQTLRDTFCLDDLPNENSKEFQISVPSMPGIECCSGGLLALLDVPKNLSTSKGLVLLVHGLGGSSRRHGLRRMGARLIEAGFCVLRLNLRGSDPCRHIVPGTYAAQCNSDLKPVLELARNLCRDFGRRSVNNKEGNFPLFGVGISLGGTILLNACFDQAFSNDSDHLALDGLICTSSPLDLSLCSKSIERPRNLIYQRWLLNRLVKQTLSDKLLLNNNQFNSLAKELKGANKKLSIRDFDNLITAPRWGYRSVDEYYTQASPLRKMLGLKVSHPPIMMLQSLDDPWVPYDSALLLQKHIVNSKCSNINVVLTNKGGHNGFHGINGCWGDELVVNTLLRMRT